LSKLKKYIVYIKVYDDVMTKRGWVTKLVWRKFRTVTAKNKKEALEKAYDIISDLSRPIDIHGVKVELVKRR